MIRMTRIVYAFRNKVWPKPMEGLDLFMPMVKQDEISSESSEEEENGMARRGEEEGEAGGSESDSDCIMTSLIVHSKDRKRRPRRVKAASNLVPGCYEEEGFVDIEGEGVKDFEIEKSQGLKLTLKKSSQAATSEESESMQVGVGYCNFHWSGSNRHFSIIF